jgi:hypothetical protein
LSKETHFFAIFGEIILKIIGPGWNVDLLIRTLACISFKQGKYTQPKQLDNKMKYVGVKSDKSNPYVCIEPCTHIGKCSGYFSVEIFDLKILSFVSQRNT